MSLWGVDARSGIAVAAYRNPPMNDFCAEEVSELAALIESWRDPAVARLPRDPCQEAPRLVRAPAPLGVFAGEIDYQRYGFLERQVIRFIMWLTRGPTGSHDCVEFTDWTAVDAFARRVSSLQPDRKHG